MYKKLFIALCVIAFMACHNDSVRVRKTYEITVDSNVYDISCYYCTVNKYVNKYSGLTYSVECSDYYFIPNFDSNSSMLGITKIFNMQSRKMIGVKVKDVYLYDY